MKYNPYSHSKIETYFSCPYKFKLKYIDKIKTPLELNKALPRGNLAHLIIENDYNYDVEFELTEVFTEQDRKETIEMLKIFEKSDIGKYYFKKDLKNEEEFSFKIQGNSLVLTTYWDKESWFRGKIDANYIENNMLNIVDYKTGKYKTPEQQNDSQTKMYAIWGFLKYPEIDTISASFVYIEHLKENRFVYRRSQFSSLVKEFYSKTKEVETTEYYKFNVSPLCGYCEFEKYEYCNKRKEIQENTSSLINNTIQF